MAARISRKRSSSRRELIKTGTHKRFVRRTKRGQFKESDEVGRSLRVDRRKTATRRVKAGYGDRGNQKKQS